MATQSSPPPNPADDKPQNQDTLQPKYDVQQNASTEDTKQSSTASVFVNSEPMREDQVQNAVKFLSHPKVRGSPVMYRRSFLEKKGLTKEEIDEAFRRVPDPPSSSQAASTNQDGQVKPTLNYQPQSPMQTLQPAAASPTGVVSSVGALVQSRFHWYHAILAVGVLAISGAGTAVLIKNALVPRLKSWIRNVVSEEDDDPAKKINAKPSLAEETAAAAKAAAAAAADVAKASQEMLSSKNEDKRYFEEFMNLLDVQVKEMKSMSVAIRKLEGQANKPGTASVFEEDHGVSNMSSKHTYANGEADVNSRSVRPSSSPASTEPSVAPHPKSYMEIMAMVQRGEKPPNIRDINDQPPNPNQQIPNPRVAPRTKPWEVGQAQNSSNQVLQSQVSVEGLNSNAQYNGLSYQLDGESSVPWRQQRSARITEIENEDELKAGAYGIQTNEQRVQRTWVPPQPPSVVMAEAAEAIRRPKSTVQREQSADDLSASRPDDAADELHRVTKISESGGAAEIIGEGSGLNSSEIQIE
ncbi:peroxisomal membrane protein PEX14 [Tripterygium wilfordii]|uniref:Peroxisomal membrane protein PEX14 n=1 Tax=Tripterygium wilfordii TaxID=458696 RepID=A0A7J7DZZ8_TRIWF|nr:peroxisomal membrane protein PEX14-like isoform X1 [Tripterygium wilfordii]KAF5751873.1 peroxisomal membrane protein PEX14 [Tripterygium wilfordii]